VTEKPQTLADILLSNAKYSSVISQRLVMTISGAITKIKK
jgi:hypothetical protein